ncbi:unnamed protein product [Tilletia controversa]|uniref:Uncharacterized protein n=1 Tax=Tilletia controversa TaxID=13291 RepID=A0A8X7T0Q2_9BASI|nr:hypothetical protein CF328_g1974 [Tilletia controversa]KAE8254502.1 hypothetical protein A4X06_0g863 [Tilletia controversa]CAD6904545.1 unnamed protein product [Tilletia controversa]CAD6916250.1 unnamed protein product [Tilletia controversa]CAD6916489.1 unnamed protein product [Tilletia controversa]
MVDWHSQLVQQQCFEAIIILVWLSVGSVVREQINTAYFDWQIIAGRRERKWAQAVYLLAKVAWWVYIALVVVLVYTFNEVDCNHIMWATEAFMGLVTLCCSILLAIRTVCVYQRTARTVVTSFLVVFTLALAAAWGQGVTSVTAVWVPGAGKPWTTGMCVWSDVRTDYSVKYIVTIIFDLTVLILTVYGIARLEGSTTKIGQTLVKQGIVYFVVTCVVNAVITGFTIAHLNPIMSLILAVPTAAVTLTASTRLYVELAEGTRPLNPKSTYSHSSGGPSSFGTSTGNSTFSYIRKRNITGMFSKGTSAGGSRLEKLPTSMAPSSPFGDNKKPTRPFALDDELMLVQSLPFQPVSQDHPHLSTVEEDVYEYPRPPGPAADSTTGDYAAHWSRSHNEESGCPSDCGTPSSNCVHRKRSSDRHGLTVLPSAAAAAANLMISESQIVTSEATPVHLQHPSTSSLTSQEPVATEYPMLSGNRPSDGRSL